MASASVSSVSGITAVLNLDDGGLALTVLKFRYEEELGQPFAIEIELESTSGGFAGLQKLSPERVVGRTLAVKISDGPAPIRHFHAIMETFVAVDNDGDFNRYRGTAVPWYSLLKLAENSKIYYDITATGLIDLIYPRFLFAPESTPVHKVLAPVNRKVRTQYGETYFQFLQRSLEQEGIYYYWTHTSKAHVMHTTDGMEPASPFPNYDTIPYDHSTGATECIYEWSHHAAVQPQQVVLNDYNYLGSQENLMVAQDNLYRQKLEGFGADTPYDRLAVFRHPGSYSTKGGGSGNDAGTGNWYAKRLAQAFECRQAFVSGKARCVGLAAGHTFTVTWDKPNPYSFAPYSLNNEYLTTKMTLDIDLDISKKPVVDCAFEAIPVNDKIKYRPMQTVPTPRIDGVQSAIVCKAEQVRILPFYPTPRPVTETRSDDKWQQDEAAAEGFNTPYCNVEKGVARVQVKFHWCRGVNERTDWIRLTHLMAGNGWGEFHLPRPGDEVLVAFEHGDPDRPVIVGSLYNDTHAMPFDLGDKDEGDKLKKLFAIKDPGGNLFIMDPGTETHPEHPKAAKGQTISLYSPSTKHPSSVQIGQNDEKWPGKPHH